MLNLGMKINAHNACRIENCRSYRIDLKKRKESSIYKRTDTQNTLSYNDVSDLYRLIMNDI